MPSKRRPSRPSPPSAIPAIAAILTPAIPRVAAIADERTRLDHAVRSGAASVTVRLPLRRQSAAPVGDGTMERQYAIYRLVGVRDDLTCEFVRVGTNASWGMVHLALRCSPEGRFWRSALRVAGLARHPHFQT